MAWTADALAKALKCSWQTVRRAIAKGELKASWDASRRVWAIDDEFELVQFRARLEYLSKVRRERAERMKALWRSGKLKPRRKRVNTVVVERLKRPTIVAVGQGAYSRTVGIVWQGDEGLFCCPSCAAPLKVR